MAYSLFMDGFNRDSLGGGKWAAWGDCVINTTHPRFGSGCLERPYGAGGSALRTRLFPASSHVVLGFAVLLTGEAQNIVVRLGPNWAAQAYLHITDFGIVTLYKGDGTWLWQASVDFYSGAWNFVEFGLHCAAVGSYEVRVNGNPDGSVITGVDTQYIAGQTINSAYFGWDGPGDTGCLIDDVYITYGDEIKFLGDCRVDTYALNADTTPQEWVPDTAVAPGANHTLLNQDAGAIFAADAGDISLFGLEPPGAVNIIHGVQLCCVASKADAGDGIINLIAQPAATPYHGADIHLSTSPITYRQAYVTSPETSAPWTPSELDALQIGVRATQL